MKLGMTKKQRAGMDIIDPYAVTFYEREFTVQGNSTEDKIRELEALGFKEKKEDIEFTYLKMKGKKEMIAVLSLT